MTPFEQLRLWLARAPLAEKAAAALTTIIVLGLIGWAAVPLSGAASSGLSDNRSRSAPGITSFDQVDGSSSPDDVAPPGPLTGECVSPPGTDQGVTHDEIHVAVTLPSLGGAAGNATFGLPSTAVQRESYQAVINDINSQGGFACHKLVATYYPTNDSTDAAMHQTCLKMLQAKPFAVMGTGFAPQAPCIAANGVPFIGETAPLNVQRQYYPYVIAGASADITMHNSVFALKKLGYFDASHGFNKAGVIYEDCAKDVTSQYFNWLRQAGVGSDQIVKFDLGCLSNFATPSALRQAVLTFKNAGVTNVLPINMDRDFANFTRTAAQEKFTPKYGIGDGDGILEVTYGLLGPDFANIKGAIGIDASGFGAEHSNVSPSAATTACNSIMHGIGQPPVYQELVGFGGVACSQVWLLQAMLNHAPALTRAKLSEGLQAAGPVAYSYPEGPSDFSKPGVTVGGEYWRAMQFATACNCYQLLETRFQAGFGDAGD